MTTTASTSAPTRISAHDLADQLAAVEEMEDRLQRLLEPAAPDPADGGPP